MNANGLRPYPAYRDSGVQWLGKVPEHWEVRRASSRLHVRNRPIHPREISQGEIFHYSIPNVQQHGGGRREATSSVDSGKTLVDRELLLVSKLNPRKGTIALAVPHPTLTTIASGEFVTMEPGACLGVFARYVYVSESVRLELSSRVNSATKSHQRCTTEDIAKLRVPWPPTDEQTTIVRFLDDADRRIRRYIQAKERLIELLQERKRALIHEAVTGRTDVSTGQPYPAYKDSGVQWLGKVPKHWEVRRVATVGDLRVSNVDKHVREGESPVRLCNYMHVYHNERIGSDLPFMAGTATEREIRRFRLAVGDVLVTKDSEDWSDIGVPALVEYAADDLVCGYHLAMLRPDGAFLDGGYLFQALRDSHVAWQFQVAAAGVTRYGLSQNAIRSMRVPLPPPSEQRAIARFLEAADRRIRRHISATKRQIALLKEYRTRLIADVVTGKLDVREASARLPETAPLSGDRNRAETIPPESNLHSTAHDMARAEAKGG